MKTHLVSFADGKSSIIDAGQRLLMQARKSEWFDSVTVWNLNRIRQFDPEWMARHDNFINQNPRGFGYWIWKSKIIEITLNLTNINDIIVYMDAGCEINEYGHERFKSYINFVSRSKFFAFYLNGSNYSTRQWTKAGLMQRFDVEVNNTIAKHPQIEATFFMLKNSKENSRVISKWQSISVEKDYRFINDILSINESEDFIENRHDQAILSLILYVKKYGSIIRNENYFPNLWQANVHPALYPIAAFRNLTGVSRINSMQLI